MPFPPPPVLETEPSPATVVDPPHTPPLLASAMGFGLGGWSVMGSGRVKHAWQTKKEGAVEQRLLTTGSQALPVETNDLSGRESASQVAKLVADSTPLG